MKILHAKLRDPLECGHWWLFGPRALRQEQVLGEMADRGSAPHCPLVVLSFTTPSLVSAPSQQGSKRQGLSLRGVGGQNTAAVGVSMLTGLRDLSKRIGMAAGMTEVMVLSELFFSHDPSSLASHSHS